jgi:SAM-dependent methyltransferase
MMKLPTDLRGQSFLDIGANDGFFSFQAERYGADKVLALDKYADVEMSGNRTAWDRKGIEMVHQYLDSKIKIVSASFEDCEFNEQFDNVLISNVLVWMHNIETVIAKLSSITRGVLYIRDGFLTDDKKHITTKGGPNFFEIGKLIKILNNNGFEVFHKKQIFYSESVRKSFETFHLISSENVVPYFSHPWSVNPLGEIYIPTQVSYNHVNRRYFVSNKGWVDSIYLNIHSDSLWYKTKKKIRNAVLPMSLEDRFLVGNRGVQNWILHCRRA